MTKRRVDWFRTFSWSVVVVSSALIIYQMARPIISKQPTNFPILVITLAGLVAFVYRWIRGAGELHKKDQIISKLKDEIRKLGGSPVPSVNADEDELPDWEKSGGIQLGGKARDQLREILGDNAIE
ncbi:MAG: hypothetical protein G01um101420_648 [Parcubacteria group bacterium Gr01-1014_20]|nr:MAG: hypothetical protein G01um101420_648 [Parcubacteria group bacterium Gr01-1014_20]